MVVTLEGGCRVSDMRDGEAIAIGTMKVWSQVTRAHGAKAISLRVLEFASGVSPGWRNDQCDEVLYFLENDTNPGPEHGEVTIFIDGWPQQVRARTGIYLRPRQTLTIKNSQSEPVVFISSQCPEPTERQELLESIVETITKTEPEYALVNLADRRAIPTADRWYRVLVDDKVGSTEVTQFVGSIPPGRAPDHFHEYEEVLFILRGEGHMWAGETNAKIAAGSCIYLPRRQVHCVENTGDGELRLLGVFYPAGSPSVRYDA